MARLIGGSDLRLRLESLKDVGPEFAAQWAEDARNGIATTAPNARNPASRKFSKKVTRLRAAVYGAYWWVFVDRGTKAHDILGSGGKNPPTVLMFKKGDRTIFTKKVNHPRTRRNPFISRAAQAALAGVHWPSAVIKQWNRRRIGGAHTKFL
jgi:hypothetical protein